jgi:hypothetical protein
LGQKRRGWITESLKPTAATGNGVCVPFLLKSAMKAVSMTLRGRVKNGVVVFQNEATAPLPDGTLVEIRPLTYEAGSPSAVLAAMEADPDLSPEDIAELNQAITAGKRPAASIAPFSEDSPGPV